MLGWIVAAIALFLLLVACAVIIVLAVLLVRARGAGGLGIDVIGRAVGQAVGAVARAAGSCEPLAGSGEVVTEARDVRAFRRVSVSWVGQLEVVQSTDEGLEIEAEDNILPYIESVVVGDQLRIGLATGAPVQITPRKPIIYRLRARELSEIELSGAVNATSEMLRSPSLVVALSGASKLALACDVDKLDVSLSGAGQAEMRGRADTQRVLLSGAGKYTAPALTSKSCHAEVSGAGAAEVSVADSLEVQVSGAGAVTYHGDPEIREHISGVGSVRRASA